MKMLEIIYALLALFGLGAMFLLIKYGLNKGLTSEVTLFYQVLFMTFILGVILLFTSKTSFIVNKPQLLILIMIGVVGAFANIFLFKALNFSTNPGYVLAITNLNALVVLIASFFIFGAKFDIIKLAGTLLAVIGVVLISLK
jgi:drug/metabolite transporter (DMT)-like permease